MKAFLETVLAHGLVSGSSQTKRSVSEKDNERCDLVVVGRCGGRGEGRELRLGGGGNTSTMTATQQAGVSATKQCQRKED